METALVVECAKRYLFIFIYIYSFQKYAGYNWDENNGAGSLTCLKMIVISNCEYAMQVSTSSYFCYSCKKGFAVNSNQTACASFNKDPYCRKLSSGNTQCENCYHGYVWDTVKCRMKSLIFLLQIGII